MSHHWGSAAHPMYTPKQRIKKKVEKPACRERYERRVEGRACFNSHGKLVGVSRVG